MPYAFTNAVGQHQLLFAPQQGTHMHLLTPPSHQQQTSMQQVQMPYQANTGGFTNFGANRRGRGRGLRGQGRGRCGRSQYVNHHQQQFVNQQQFKNQNQFANQHQFAN